MVYKKFKAKKKRGEAIDRRQGKKHCMETALAGNARNR